MKLAPQPVRRKLRAKSAPPNLSTCPQCASIASAISTFRTLSKNCRAVSESPPKFFRSRSSDAKCQASKPFRMNTCESVSKQRTLTTFRMHTYEKHPRRGTSEHLRHASLSPSYAPRGASIPCGLSRLRILPVTTGVYPLRAGSEVQFVRGPAFDILYFVILAMKTE